MYLLTKIDDNTIVDIDLTKMLNVHVKVEKYPFRDILITRHNLIITTEDSEYIAVAYAVPDVCQDWKQDSIIITDFLTRISCKITEVLWDVLNTFNRQGASQGQARPMIDIGNIINSELSTLSPSEKHIYKYFVFDCHLLQKLTENGIAKQGQYAYINVPDHIKDTVYRPAYIICKEVVNAMGEEFIQPPNLTQEETNS